MAEHTTAEEMLAAARAELERVGPEEAAREQRQGAALVDIRVESQIAGDGRIPGAEIIARNVLEWRLDPASDAAIAELAVPGRRVVVFCDAGYQSSLAAVTLRRLGIDATDLDGGFQAWLGAGLPVERD